MGDIFSGAVNGVKSFLGIHSPSKLFMSIGKYIDSGLTMGLNADMGKVDGAMRRLTENFSIPTMSDLSYVASVDSTMREIDKNMVPDWVNRLIRVIESNSDKHIEFKLDSTTFAEATTKSINDLSFLKNASSINF